MTPISQFEDSGAENVSLNKLDDAILPMHMAVSDRKSSLTLELGESNDGDHRVRTSAMAPGVERDPPDGFYALVADIWPFSWMKRRGHFARYPIVAFRAFLNDVGLDGYYDNVIFTRA